MKMLEDVTCLDRYRHEKLLELFKRIDFNGPGKKSTPQGLSSERNLTGTIDEISLRKIFEIFKKD